LFGKVVQRGGVWGSDSGGLADSPARRLTHTRRVTVDVREAFFVDRAGNRRLAPAHVGRHEIDQPWWESQADLGEEVALLCLPGSTDPVLKLDPARLRGHERPG